MKKVRIVGVPEHFNLPWHLAMAEGAFAHRGIDLDWTDVPEGTGRMAQMLQDGETDLAVILTEGLIKSIDQGNPAMIVQEYIATPLLWGIHVAANSSYRDLKELHGTRAAISRFGSGSHLMTYVMAQNQGWDTNLLQFVVVDTLEGAVNALTDGKADYFMWERFTTLPLVQQGVFRRLGDCPTPWPCFVLVATREFCKSNSGVLSHLLNVINLYTAEFKRIPSIDRTLSNQYRIELSAIRTWLSLTRWSQNQISLEDFDNVQETLYDLNLLSNKMSYEKLIWTPPK